MQFDSRGIVVPDCSFYQDNDLTPQKIDFVKMKAAGVKGVILRAGQNSWLDEDFSDYWKAAKAAGLPRGAYWFYDSRSAPAKQANLWNSIIGYDLPELGLWADLEENYNGSYKTETHYKDFIAATRSYFPKTMLGIYTANWWWYDRARLGLLRDDAFWGAMPLWVAQYGVESADVFLPRPWVGKRPIFWQYTASGDGPFYGVESEEIDLNLFNGDEQQFRIYFNLGEEIIPVPGEPMYFKATTTVNIRSSAATPSDNSNDLGTFNLLANDIAEVDDLPLVSGGITWRRLRKIWRNNQPIQFVQSPTGEFWAAEKNTATTFLMRTNFTPPVTSSHVVEVYIDGILEFRKELA